MHIHDFVVSCICGMSRKLTHTHEHTYIYIHTYLPIIVTYNYTANTHAAAKNYVYAYTYTYIHSPTCLELRNKQGHKKRVWRHDMNVNAHTWTYIHHAYTANAHAATKHTCTHICMHTYISKMSGTTKQTLPFKNAFHDVTATLSHRNEHIYIQIYIHTYTYTFSSILLAYILHMCHMCFCQCYYHQNAFSKC